MLAWARRCPQCQLLRKETSINRSHLPTYSHTAVITSIALLASCVILFGCSKSKETQAEEAWHATVGLLQTMKEAAQELDIKKYLSPYDHSLEFAAFINGAYFDYDGFASACTGGIRPMKKYELVWDTLHTRVVSPGLVVTYAPFRELLIDSSGAEGHMEGDGTWIARRIDGDWKFVYADIRVHSVPGSR